MSSGPALPTARSLLTGRYRAATLGILLVVTVVALEGMAVASVMPVTVRSLHGLALYGWAFTGFFIASVAAIVDAGARCDRSGPAPSLLAGLGLFAAGLLVAGTAPDMPLFVVGRAVQGLGAGSALVAVYVLVARVYPQSLRPRVFAATSAAWVAPALVGPAAAGAVATAVGWRWVFLGLVPVALVGIPLLAGAVRGAGAPADVPPPARVGATGGLLLAGGLAALEAALDHPAWWAGVVGLLGVAAAARPLVALLPAGAVRMRRGLPATVLLRGVLAASFFGAEAFLPLTLTAVHRLGPAQSGLPLTVAALGWASGSWWQGRRGRGRERLLLRAGFALVAVSIGSLSVVGFPSVSPWLAVPLWAVGGAGMGLAMPTVSVLTLALSPPAEQGANSAALQVCDVVGTVLGIGVGGSAVALTGAHGTGLGRLVVGVDLGLAALAAVGAWLAGRAGAAAGPTQQPVLAGSDPGGAQASR